MNKKPGLLEFPCHFPIKIFCKKMPDVAEAVFALISEDLVDPKTPPPANETDRYICFTALLMAKDSPHVRSVHKKLKALNEVVMVL